MWTVPESPILLLSSRAICDCYNTNKGEAFKSLLRACNLFSGTLPLKTSTKLSESILSRLRTNVFLSLHSINKQLATQGRNSLLYNLSDPPR